MRTALISLLVSLIASPLGAFLVYNYAPVSFFETSHKPTFGTTVTTINGSDTLSSSRTTINDNFTALNAGKIENSTTSLPKITTLAGLTSASGLTSLSALATVGTITSGTWNGTGITAAFGGTGATSLSNSFSVVSNVFSNVIQPSVTYSTTTAWTGTTTIVLQQVTLAETLNGVRCMTLPGGSTLNVQYGYGAGTTSMLTASSSNAFNAFTANNTPAAGNTLLVKIGTPASSPTDITCTSKITQ